MAETKSQKVFGANSYVCRSYMGKSGSGAFLDTPHEIVHLTFFLSVKNFAEKFRSDSFGG